MFGKSSRPLCLHVNVVVFARLFKEGRVRCLTSKSPTSHVDAHLEQMTCLHILPLNQTTDNSIRAAMRPDRPEADYLGVNLS